MLSRVCGMAAMIAAFGSVAASYRASRSPQAEKCEARVIDQVALRTAAGDTISIDASTMTKSGDRVLMLGATSWLFHPRAGGFQNDSIFGAVRERDGGITAVPVPPGTSEPQFPRAAPSPSGGWDVVFVTGKEGMREDVLAFGSASIWHGHYDNGWRGVERIATVTSARLRYSTDLVRTTRALYWAFIFNQRDSSTGPVRYLTGTIMVWQQNGRWRLDTLRALDDPVDVHLAAAPTARGVVAEVVERRFGQGTVYPPALLTSRFDDGWSKRVEIVADKVFAVGTGRLVAIDDGFVTTWRQYNRGRAPDETMMAAFDADGLTSVPEIIAPVSLLEFEALTPLGASRAVALRRAPDVHDKLMLYIYAAGKVSPAGSVSAPFDNYVPLAIDLDSTTLLLLTGAVHRDSKTAPALGYLTRVAITCR